jgi:hypothetical protein
MGLWPESFITNLSYVQKQIRDCRGCPDLKKGYSRGVTKRCRLYLGRPIAPSYMSPNGGGGGVAWSQPMSTAVHIEPKINFGNITSLFNLWVIGTVP